jgi:LPXTG-motif cell wall-anchored protein
MTFRRRLGVLATAVSGLLVAGLLLSAPAFAWSAQVKDLTATCPPGSDKTNVVSGHVILSKEEVGGHVVIEYKLDSGDFVQVVDQKFSAGQTNLDFSFSVPADEGSVTVRATAFFDDNKENPSGTAYTNLEKCKGEETTPTQPTTPPTQPPSPTETTPTAAPTTAALGKAATTAGVSGLPRTGSNPVPMLIAALVLVVGGGGLLFASRFRSRQAK